MAEQQLPTNQEELNQEVFTPDVKNILGYDKDMFGSNNTDILPKINPTEKLELPDESLLKWTDKSILDNLNSITEENKENVTIDKDGNIDYSAKDDNATGVMMNQKFSDPILDEKRNGLINDLSKNRQDEIDALNEEADKKIASGELNKKRRERYIEKNTKEIDKKYKKLATEQYLSLYNEDKDNNDNLPRRMRKSMKRIERELDNLYTRAISLGAGDPLSLQDIVANSSDPEFQNKYKDVKSRGVTSLGQFEQEFKNKGNVKVGDVYLGYMTSGHITDDAFQNNSRPVYFQAIEDASGNRTISPVKAAFVHPITKEVIGAYTPLNYETQAFVISDYTHIAGKTEFIKGIDADLAEGRINASEYEKKKKSFEEGHINAVKRNIEAYNEIMSSDKFSKITKMAVIASVFPNQFQEQYNELLEGGSKNILEDMLGKAVSLPFKGIGLVAGAVSTGIDELTQWYAGIDDVEFPMGTLALELKKNPGLASEMDKILNKKGNRGSVYTSSIEGLADLTHAAKITLKNKEIDAVASYGKSLMSDFSGVVQGFNSDRLSTELEIKNFSNGYLDILNKSGYMEMLNTAYKINGELLNSPDKDTRDAYRFLQLKQKIANYDGGGNALSTLSKEDIEFINTTGQDLIKNKINLLNTVVEKVNQVADAFNKAKDAFPTQEVKDYENKNKGRIDRVIANYKEKQSALFSSSAFSPRATQTFDLIQALYKQFDAEASDNKSYTFPMLSRSSYKAPKNILAMINPGIAMGMSLLDGVSDIFRLVESTANLFGNVGSDLQKNYVSAGLSEYKRVLQTTVQPGSYAVEIAQKIGSALPQMAAFVGSFMAGGPMGGFAYLAATMTGDKMREAANAGLDPIESMLYTGFSIGIELGSEAITSEASLLGLRGSKSILTKDLLNRIMNVGTRKEALKEYARLAWNTSKGTVRSGTLEAFEEEVADKGNYILQNLFNNTHAASFNPSVFTLQESFDNVLVMTATGGLFKGGTGAFNKQKPVELGLKKDLQAGGMSSESATLVAGLSSPTGLKTAIDFVNQVESGEISRENLNVAQYDFMKNTLIPGAMKLQSEMMSLSANTNISIQQRSVALFNLMQINEVKDRVESGEIAAGSAETVIQQLQENADKALKDRKFAEEQFGLDDTGLVQKITDYFGVSDMSVNEDGALDGSTSVSQGVTSTTPQEVVGDKPAVESKIVDAENDAADAASSNLTTSANPNQVKSEADASAVSGAIADEQAATTPAVTPTTTPTVGGAIEGAAMTATPASTTQTVSAPEFQPLTRSGLAERLKAIVSAPMRRFKARGYKEKMIEKNPEKALLTEIYNTNAKLAIAQDRYNEVVASGKTAPTELAEVRILTKQLNDLVSLKDNYTKTTQYATEIAEGLRQEGAQPSNIGQYQGTEEGQLEEGERERRRREDAQSSANYRNSNFGSQAQQATQEIASMPNPPQILQTYLGGMQAGQEVQLMDEIASQVAIDEPAAISQFGQPVVDRVKQYMAETEFTTDLPVVREASVRNAETKVSQSEDAASVVADRANQATSKAHKKAVTKLIDRLKQAFPNVKVFMDKKGFEAAMQDPAARELMTKGGVVYGRVLNGDVYLNPDFSNYNTPIHEFGHLWLNVAAVISPDVYNRGIELIRDSEYVTRLQGDPLYDNLTKEQLEDEALATAIGDRGERFVFESQREGFRGWMTRMLRKLAQYAGIFNLSNNELRALDLDTYLNMVNASLLAGQPLTRESIRSSTPSGFMAKMNDAQVQSLTILAQNYFDRAITKGRDLEAARREALSELSVFVINKYMGKSNFEDLIGALDGIIESVSAEQKEKVIQQKKTEKLNQAFKSTEVQGIVGSANQEASRLAQGKVKAADAAEQVTKMVKDGIQKMYDDKKGPAGISWINMMSLAPSIAADAIMAAYPQTNRRSLFNEDMVIMTTGQWIRNAVSNQVRAIKDVEKRTDAIIAAVKDIFKQMTEAYGVNVELSPRKVNAIIAEIESGVFNRSDVMSSVSDTADAISKILETEYRKKLIEQSATLIDKIKQKASKAKYGASDLMTKAMQIVAIDLGAWRNSNATLEDIASFNGALNDVLGGDLAQFDFAIQKATGIVADNNVKVENEYKSLTDKMNRMIKKAGNLDLSDYASIVAFKKAMDDVAERKGNMALFTAQQMTEIQQKYAQILTSLPAGKTIDDIANELENEISNELNAKVNILSADLTSEASSDVRTKVKNPLLYHQLLSLSKLLKGDGYLDSLSAKDKLSLINAIDGIMTNGNYNYDVYNEYIKAKKYFLKKNMTNWAKSLAKNRRSLSAPGLTGLVTSKFKNFFRAFTDVEGTTPSAELIADNFDILRLHSMDVELFNGRGKAGYDMFDMGFLEREIFAPMASGVDGAVNKTQAKLQNLQDAMILLGDKSNRAVVKKALRGLREQYGVGSSLNFRRLAAMFKRGSNENLYVEISTRMASIIAHQIDHISNLREDQVADDMILKRNILDGIDEDKKENLTMAKRYGKLGGLSTLTGKYNELLDAIAYSDLTNNGTTTLAGLNEQELLDKLTLSQRKALTSWRSFIDANKDLVESSMIINGNTKALIKNYFPRRVAQVDDVTTIADYEEYINSQFENVGLSKGQIMERTGNAGRLDLNGNKVILNNLKSLNLLNQMKPYIDYIKAIGESVQELKDMAAENQDEAMKRQLNFAAAYAEGVQITIKRRLDNSLLNGDKAVNQNFSFLFKAVSVSQKFAANMWLISTMRQLGSDYPANILKTSAALAYANKTDKLQTWRLLSPSKSSVKTSKGKFYWDDYVKIAELTGSPVYRTVSMYSDNFLYDYSKTPEQAQRKQRVMSWQDMAVKKQAWMERFEGAFERLTEESFDHQAFSDERGAYRAMFMEAVETASKAADSTIDRQFGLPSFARQPLRVNPFVPFFGRPIRYLINTYLPGNLGKYITIPKTNPFTFITGFMMGYPSIQFSLFRNYMKLAFSSTSGLSAQSRAKYISQALTEAYIPTFAYGLSRTFFGMLMASAGYAVYSAAGDEDEEEKMFKEMEQQSWWERQLSKFKLQMRESEEKVFENIINSLSANVIDPQQTYFARMVGGFMLFNLWKKEAILAMDKREVEETYEFNGQMLTSTRKMTKEERSAMGKKIKQDESWWWNTFNVRPIEIYGGEEYENAVRKYDIGWAAGDATKGWETLFESIGGFSEIHKTASSVMTTYDLWKALDENQNIKKDELLLASILKGYGLIFANFMLGGKYGWTASLFSGDATKLSNTIIRDLDKQNKRHEKELRDKEKKGSSGGGGMYKTEGKRKGMYGGGRRNKGMYGGGRQ